MTQPSTEERTNQSAFEDRPEVEQAMLDDTTVAGLGEADSDEDPQTPLFQEPGQPPL